MAQAQTVDDVAGAVLYRGELHKPVLPVLAVEMEGVPYQRRRADGTEAYAQPLLHAAHIEDYEQHEIRYKTSREDEQVLRFQPLVFHRSAYALVNGIFHFGED